ncbi:putative major facilitator superfamily transporter [Colletotrichum sublineola]|uniref:Putative major facilitator superfamily transporter n=1 Tax=Colletotrichum sublineola TaxID=1173701 RepID=A0A066XDH9_COLSU|nr:putative major facilitator superfamily transporter [Colletotrichum sublineola]
MDATMFKTLVEVESRELDKGPPLLPAAPAKAVQRTYPGAPQRDGLSIELSRINTNPNSGGAAADKTGASIVGSPRAQSPSLSRPSTSGTDVEMSRPSSPAAFEVLQSISDPHMNRYRLAAACLMNFGNGLNDSAPGALIPYIEK